MAYIIEIEGIAGAGKTTLAPYLKSYLERRGIATKLLQEPGGSPMGNSIRKVIMDHREEHSYRSVLTEMLLFLANRSDVQRIHEEAFNEEKSIVLFDRYYGSTIVYQLLSIDRDSEKRPELEHLLSTNMQAIRCKKGGMVDSTILLNLPVEMALDRVIKREESNNDEYRGNYYEALGKNFISFNEDKKKKFMEYYYEYYKPSNIIVDASQHINTVVVEATYGLGKIIKKWGLI